MAMNETRFIELLSAYGAELSRWPEAERADAAMLLEAAPHRIKDLWESERVFDTLLSVERDAPAPVALEKRLIAAAPARRPQAARGAWPGRWAGRWSPPQWAAGGAIAASLALGFAVGYAAEPSQDYDAGYSQILALAGSGGGAMFLAAIEDTEH